MICNICNREIDRWCSLASHIHRTHKMEVKDYYDKYIEPGVEHKCKVCGKDLPFSGLQFGYEKLYCSSKCFGTTIKYDLEAKKKREETCLKKYGAKCFLGSKFLDRSVNYGGTPESIAKIKATKLARHGNENYCNMEKVYETKKERYGDPFYSNREQTIKTCIEKYGTANIFSLDSVKEKSRKTCLEHYGVEYPTQNRDIRIKGQKKNIVYNDIRFDSSWELAYYLHLKRLGIPFEYQPKTTFTYEYAGKTHVYMPDFKVGEEYIEIKGPQFFENKDGTGKMINPWDRTQDEGYEAKHQCMLRNNVKIITECSEFLHELDGIKIEYIDVDDNDKIE